MNASKRMVNVFFVLATLILWVLFTNTLELVFDMIGEPNRQLLGEQFTLATLCGAGLALAVLFWTWRHPVYRPHLNEVGDELSFAPVVVLVGQLELAVHRFGLAAF